MNATKLTQSVSIALTAAALSACGGSDTGGDIYNSSPAPTAPQPAPIAPVETTPVPSTPSTDFVALAKQAGLTDDNAQKFADSIKGMAIDSQEYKDALAQALKAQEAANVIIATKDPVSVVVEKANPFISGIDVTKTATVSANHYVRQLGSTYERTANPTAVAGLGAIATEEPTNPWLSNFVLGTESVREPDGTRKAVATDSAGEMVVAFPTNDNPNQGQKLGVLRGRSDGYAENATEDKKNKDMEKRLSANGDRKSSPYFTTYNGLVYKTQRSDGNPSNYEYATGVSQSPPQGTGAKDNVRTLQEMYSQHGTTPRQNLIDSALAAAKNKNYINYTANPRDDALNNGTANKDGKGAPFVGGYSDYTRAGLIVYNDRKIGVGNATGAKLGYLVPAYGREENVYMMNEDTGELEVINGVDVSKLSSNIGVGITFENGQKDSADNWYSSRYGAWVGNGKGQDGSAKQYIRVANNDSIRLFGKNMLGYDAGAEGEQLHDNTYIAKYTHKNTLGAIRPAKLHHVQYGRLTNNIDVLAADSVTDEHRIIYRDFQSHGTPNSVDTYFYRGTNHTSLETMQAIKANGGTYRYHGHALTYNLGPYVKQDTQTQGTPTAFGSTSEDGSTIGNFVEATFDIAKGKVDGSIYNFINKDVAADENNFEKQELATFTGDVYGNTVVGTSAKVGTDQVGSLTASFFGENAAELGGNISSISRQEGYGDAKWGAVFGATRGSIVDNYNIIEQDNSTR